MKNQKFVNLVKLVADNAIKSEGRNSITAIIEGREMTITKRLTINSQDLIPTCNYDVLVDGKNASWGMSGCFLSNEEIQAINKLFIDGDEKASKKEGKERDERQSFVESIYKNL
jgi:hypothetical protein